MQTNLQKLASLIRGHQKLAIAFSGGADSVFLARNALKILGKEKVLLLRVDSVLSCPEERANAWKWAQENDAHFIELEFNPLKHPDIVANSAERCYFCKKEIYSLLRNVASQEGFDTLADGFNTDDADDYRPGRRAADEAGVIHPLLECGITKHDVLAAMPEFKCHSLSCLATRIPAGTPIELKTLQKIAAGEAILHDLGFFPCRLRVVGDSAKLEIPPTQFNLVLENLEAIVKPLKKCGFKFVTLDLSGYIQGNMN